MTEIPEEEVRYNVDLVNDKITELKDNNTSKQTVDEAVKLFSQTDKVDTVIMAPYELYLEKYIKAVNNLLSFAPNVENIEDLEQEGNEENLKKFILAFREVAKILVSLKTFNQFDLDNTDSMINTQMFEDYKSKYYELYRSNNWF